MIRFAVYGAGGFGREVKGMLDWQEQKNNPVSFGGFIDDHASISNPARSYDDILFAIADPKIRRKVVERMLSANFPLNSFSDSQVNFHPSVKLGKGCIVCPGVQFTVDIQLGNFVIVNLNATIGHDVAIGDYCSIMPSANISGNVKIGSGVLIGSGATILQGLTVGDNAIIGAGAVVTRSVPAAVTVVGVPARIKK